MLPTLIVCLIFVSLTAAYNYHPEYVNCQLAGAENLTVVYANETWQQCRDKKLEILFCVADTENGYNCVRHARVKKTIDETTGFKWYFAKAYYLSGSERNFIDCGKLKRERPEKLTASTYKMRCLTDLNEKPLELTSSQNELCHMKFHKAVYIDDTGSVYGCKNGQFEIRSCMINFQDKFKCVPKEKFSASQWNIKNFCKNFAASPATYLPNYQAALKDCNAGL